VKEVDILDPRFGRQQFGLVNRILLEFLEGCEVLTILTCVLNEGIAKKLAHIHLLPRPAEASSEPWMGAHPLELRAEHSAHKRILLRFNR